MKIAQVIIVTILASVVSSCQNQNSYIDRTQNIVGTWIYDTYDDPLEKYYSSDTIDLNNFGLVFHANNKLTKIQLIGECATPPLKFEKVIGKWTKTSDSTFIMEYEFWRGSAQDHYLINCVGSNRLQLVLIDQEVILK